MDYDDGLAVVAGFGMTSTGHSALIDNFNSPFTAVFNVQVACVAGTSRERARPVPNARAQARADLDQQIADLEAMHEEAAAR